jgi:folate-binding Fe-S cluster repair protein YgfZ
MLAVQCVRACAGRRVAVAAAVRSMSSAGASVDGRVVPLSNRAVVFVRGPQSDVSVFLQGLVTADVRELFGGRVRALAAMFLNRQGRVLADALLCVAPAAPSTTVSATSPVTVVMGIHADSQELVLSHLQRYSLDRDVEIVPGPALPGALVGVVFASAAEVDAALAARPELVGKVVVYEDPRSPLLGTRVVAAGPDVVVDWMTVSEALAAAGLPAASSPGPANEEQYTAARWRAGVAEGPAEIIAEESFPLESNLELMHGGV